MMVKAKLNLYFSISTNLVNFYEYFLITISECTHQQYFYFNFIQFNIDISILIINFFLNFNFIHHFITFITNSHATLILNIQITS